MCVDFAILTVPNCTVGMIIVKEKDNIDEDHSTGEKQCRFRYFGGLL